jgi:ferrochelatase
MDRSIIDRNENDAELRGCGVLLLNMGGPNSLEEVEPYLYRLFSDPDMIQLALGRFCQKALARTISSRRAPRVRLRYGKIGGRSPLGEDTARQASEIADRLGIPVEVGMRYSDPGVASGLDALLKKGVERFVVLPLYPQFSRTTTLSAIREFERQNGRTHPYQVIQSHHDDPGFIDAHAESLSNVIEEVPPDTSIHVIFVAHSIPARYVRNGDPYVGQVVETVDLIRQRCNLELPCSLAYQSQIGPIRWQGPSLSDILSCLRPGSVEQLVVHPVSFVTENIETLYDLDIVFKAKCQDNGIQKFTRVPALGTSPTYLDALARLVLEAARELEAQHA